MRFLPITVCLAVVVASPLQARAHLDLTSPTSRYGRRVLKTAPCGTSGGERTGNVTYFEPGETIEVIWDEYIDHPGHYRIAFDDDGVDDFVDPPLDHFVNPPAMTGPYSNDTILLDGIPDKGGDESDYMATVTLPNVTCANCTLQVIQVMTDKPPYTTGGDDIYYQCADLVLREGGAPPDAGVGADAGTDADAGTGGCATSTGRLRGLGLMSMLLLLLACRLARRRRLPV
jgi:hypothetical protein